MQQLDLFSSDTEDKLHGDVCRGGIGMKKCIYCGVNDPRNKRSYLCEECFEKQLTKKTEAS